MCVSSCCFKTPTSDDLMSVADIKIDVKTCVGSVSHSFNMIKSTTV